MAVGAGRRMGITIRWTRRRLACAFTLTALGRWCTLDRRSGIDETTLKRTASLDDMLDLVSWAAAAATCC